MKPSKKRIIISGGGTGGHLFPALSIAEALRRQDPSVVIQFVGALGKIEMEKVPVHGFPIEGLDIKGFQRSLSWDNIKFPYRLVKSLLRSFEIIKDFKPDVAVGVGGYASGPLLYAAQRKKIPCLIQEQNSFPGVTNKLLAPGSERICVAYDGMERFFDPTKILLTGNPVRESIEKFKPDRMKALLHYGFSEHQKTILLMGGSGGSRTLNESILAYIPLLLEKSIQLIWQTGRFYHKEMVARAGNLPHAIQVVPFIDDIERAYSAADLIVSRAGAGTISELSWLHKPVILVPSPNVAEDHQTKNAMALVGKGAAQMVTDKASVSTLVPTALSVLNNEAESLRLASQIGAFAKPEAAMRIGHEILTIAR